MSRSRVSAAVCLVRGEGDARECYLVRRNPELRFLGGFWAFPGGTLEEGDLPGTADEAEALARCARRELFEETGVLATPAPPASTREELRMALLGAEGPERAAARQALAAAFGTAGMPLVPLARIETPPFVPRRYDTVFFGATLPADEGASIMPGELVDGAWLRPADALARWRRGELWIAPPVRLLLELLGRSTSLADFATSAAREAARYVQGALHPVWFVPGLFLAPLRTPTLPPATTTNCYVLGERRLYVVDPASPEPAEQERLFEELDVRIAAGARIAAVLLTHGHPDHIGAVAPTCARYDVPVLAHPCTLDRVADVRGEELLGGECLPLGTSPDGRPDWHVEVHYTPGHHPGHLAFVESRYGAALLGDLVSTVSTIVIDPPEGHLRTYLASLERMRVRLGVAPCGMAFPAHGPPAPDGAALLRGFLAHRRAREERLLAALARGLAHESELVPFVYDDVDPSMHALAARSLCAGLEKLREDGLVEASAQGWRRVPGQG